MKTRSSILLLLLVAFSSLLHAQDKGRKQLIVIYANNARTGFTDGMVKKLENVIDSAYRSKTKILICLPDGPRMKVLSNGEELAQASVGLRSVNLNPLNTFDEVANLRKAIQQKNYQADEVLLYIALSDYIISSSAGDGSLGLLTSHFPQQLSMLAGPNPVVVKTAIITSGAPDNADAQASIQAHLAQLATIKSTVKYQLLPL